MRNSSIELFRIIAILFVVIVHCNGWFVGGMPDHFDENNISLFRVSQATIQAFTCTCVNMFILISGYFGLKIKWKSVVNIYMLLLSVSIPFYLINCYLGEELSLRSLSARFLAISRSGYFVECYLLLMFFSPVLNSFIKKNGKRIVAWVLAFWMIEIYFEFLLHDEDLGFHKGYSFIHFVLIYMIGRTINLFMDKLSKISKGRYLLTYLFSTLMILGSYIILDIQSAYSYTSPFNILASCCLFMVFAKITFYNHWVNWIASSTFAVYIIHVHPPVINWLRAFDVETLEIHSYPIYLLTMGGVVCFVFFGSILYDKVMKIFTVPVVDFFERIINRGFFRLSKNFWKNLK